MTHTDDDNCLQVVGHSERQDDLVVYAEKGNEELIKKFNVALSDYKKSGEYKRLIKFYFGDIENSPDTHLTQLKANSFYIYHTPYNTLFIILLISRHA